MKVSILVITYNHEAYIAQALGSIFTQETDFDYEVVIGEDASTDRTREIVLEFAEKYPEKVRVLLNNKADAEHDRERGLGGKKNFINTLSACRGQYIAWLDGDDYWTDPLKLKKQVAYFEANPKCAVCFHNAVMLSEDGLDQLPNWCPPDQKERSTIEDILKGNFIPTSSVMFRNGLLSKWPGWLYDLPFGDWPLHVLNAEHGYIGYINEVMAVYRIHGTSAWSSLALNQQLPDIIKFLGLMDAHLDFRYHDVCVGAVRDFKRRRAYQFLGEFHTRARSGHPLDASLGLIRAVKCDPRKFADPRQLAYIVKSFLIGAVWKSRQNGSRDA